MQALRADDAAAWLEAFAAYGRGLQELGEAIGAEIVTAEHREIGEEARRYGVAYKVSGAGGGDLGLACAADYGSARGIQEIGGGSGFSSDQRLAGRARPRSGTTRRGVAVVSGDRRRIPEFYKLSVEERVRTVHERGLIDTADFRALSTGQHTLDLDSADKMIENVVGVMGMPLGLGMNLVVNDKQYIVPMVVEEPSVVAAMSSACKLIRACGGFKAEATDPILIGQIQIVNLPDMEKAKQALRDRKQEIINLANSLHPNMVARGGGARDIELFVHPLPSSAQADARRAPARRHARRDGREPRQRHVRRRRAAGRVDHGRRGVPADSLEPHRSRARARELQDSGRAARGPRLHAARKRATASSSRPSSRPSIRIAPRRTTRAS